MTIRELSLQVLYQFETEGVYVRDTLDALLRRSSFDGRDRSLATELVYGTLRWRGRIDWILDQAVTRKLESLTPWIRNILRMGVYQLLMLDHIPAAAATHEAVQLAKRYGHPGTVRLTNAVLRTVLRRRGTFQDPDITDDPVAHISVAYSYPTWIVQRWLTRYGIDATIELCKAGNTPPPVVVRINRLKIDSATLRSSLNREGVQVRAGRYLNDFLILRNTGEVRSLEGYNEGWFQVQDESAGLAVRLLDPQPGEMIIDLCCAPGGKTTYIAELMGDHGHIVGIDRFPRRLRRLQEHSCRLGLKSIHPLVTDGRTCTLKTRADRVLVDAPCSGLGTIARRAELRWRRTPDDIALLHETQLALLKHSADLVKRDGVLVYSTCTIEPEENEAVVTAFCDQHPEFRIDPPSDCPPELTGVMDTHGMLRTFPSVHGIDGSFAVRMRRKE